MSFKFFRKHQKVMLWIVVVITIFTFSLFSVTSTLRTCFRQESQPKVLGEYTSPDGTKVEISVREYQHAADLLRRIKGRVVEDEIFSQIIMKNEADKAGIMISNAELNELVQSFFSSKDQYNNFIRQGQFESPKQFEESLREISQVERYKEFLKLPDELITSETLYENWKLENEEFKLDYVAFPFDEFGNDVTPETVSEEDLVAYYDGLAEASPDVKDYFSEAEKFEFDVAYLDLDKADYASFEDLLKEVDVQEHELNRHYNSTKERFIIEKPAESDEASEGDAKEEATGDDALEGEEKTAEEEAEEAQPEYKTLDEVKDQIQKEVKLAKLVEKACYEWTDYARQEKIIGKTKEEIAQEEAKKAEEEKAAKEKADAEKSGGESDASAEETPSEENSNDTDAVAEKKMSHQEYYQSIVDKYKLLTDRIEGPVSLDDLDSLDKYGSEELKMRARYLKENNAVYLRPNEEKPTMAAFVKVTDYVKRRKKSLDEVRDIAVERYILTRDRKSVV